MDFNPSKQFLTLAPERRALAFGQAATERAIDPVIIEKDFWVCWILGVTFALPEIAPHLVFKGGTSLSKVFGAIDRFSEDVDLSVSPTYIGADPGVLSEAISRRQLDRAMDEMQRLCSVKVKDTIAPILETAIRELIGAPIRSHDWLIYEVDSRAHSPNLFFQYPTTTSTDLSYVKRVVKLELGSLTDQQPVGRHPVTPWVAEVFPNVFADWSCEVTVLDLARSFWEKATILHSEYYRPENQPIPDRYARHYSDLARLLELPNATAIIADKAVADRVVEWKSRFFARTWARYDLARHGSFRLVPPESRLPELERDYAVMRAMFLHAPPAFADMMARLKMAEQRINAL